MRSAYAPKLYTPSSTKLSARSALATADCGCTVDHKLLSFALSLSPTRSMIASAKSKSPR